MVIQMQDLPISLIYGALSLFFIALSIVLHFKRFKPLADRFWGLIGLDLCDTDEGS